MIVADTSAFAAIILREPDAQRYIDAIEHSARVFVGAPTAFELHLVLVRKLGPASLLQAERLLGHPHIEVMTWDAALMPLATEALLRFRGRPACLNFGDCMTYALIKSLNLPLLYKGNDFAATDLRSALEA